MSDKDNREIPIELVTTEGEKQTFTMAATFDAVIEAERLSGKGFMQLGRDAFNAQLGFGDVYAIVAAGLKAAGNNLEAETIQQMVFRTGLAALVGPATQFIVAVVTGVTASDETDAAEPAGEATADDTASEET